MNQEVFILGCGAVGTSLGSALQRAGVTICGVYDVDGRIAAGVAERLGVPGYGGALPEGIRSAGRVLLTVPDDVIATVAEKTLAEELCASSQVWVHCSGHLSHSALQGLAGKIRGTASMHPVFVFPPRVCTALPENVHFAVDGSDEGLSVVNEWIRRLKGRVITVSEENRSLYHAAMVMGSNYLVALLASAAEVLARAGLSDEVAESLLLELSGSALSRARRLGLGHSLSGPVRRGDVGVVQDHLRSMAAFPKLRELYVQMGRATIRLAERQDGYCPDTAETLREILCGGRPR
jgi:predicted short-subunit dehydrogenase-like oxidoreductase (DUF2520 family)